MYKASLVAASVAVAFTLLTPVAHADLISFSAVRDSSLPLEQYLAGAYTYTQSQQTADGAMASVSIPSGNATARTEYGVNRVAVENNVYVDDEFLRSESIGGPFAVGISAWADRFTISGGVGTDTATVSTALTGQFGPKDDPSYGGVGFYYLWVASRAQIDALAARPFEFLVEFLEAVELDPSLAALALVQSVPNPLFRPDGERVPPGGLFGRALSGEIAFTYDESFYLVSLLGGAANDYGILNAMDSARFGITAPSGASIETESRTVYPSAVVPEPATSALLALGLLSLVAVRRRAGS
jgi:hypothetical protein